MRVLAKWGVVVMGAVLSAAAATAGGTSTVVRDWGLHREWRVECDAAHPERPARLVEVPWSTPIRAEAKRGTARVRGGPAAQGGTVPVVRAGMRVTVWRRGKEAEVAMAGTALETGDVGESIRVRAGLRNATLRGIVRGPASVELTPGRGWQ